MIDVVSCWRAVVALLSWFVDLHDDLGYLIRNVPIQHLRRDWRRRRADRQLVAEGVAAPLRMPNGSVQIGLIHPYSPRKPPGWTMEKFLAAEGRRGAS